MAAGTLEEIMAPQAPALSAEKLRQIRTEVAAAGVAPEGVWAKRIWTVRRSLRIWVFLVRSLVKVFMLKSREKRATPDVASALRREFARYLCRSCLRLGPTFIKVGQLMSTRIDLLSKEYIEELRRLQDDVPGFGKAAAVAIIESELGAPITELYDSFNENHIAAASLGQVHEAWVNNTRYAVKIQRPGVQEMFAVDLRCLQTMAKLLDRFDPQMDGTKKDWGAIFRENSRVLYEEIDYIREGRNANRFANNFKDTPWLKTPGILWELTTSKVLTMEFVEGIKISDVEKIDAAGLDRKLLARRIAECYLAQLIRHVAASCGNLAVDGKGGGRIIFYDYGMMDEVPLKTKRGFVDLVFGIYENDVKVVCDALEQMDIIRRGADRMTLERVARFYLTEFKTTMEGGGKWINELDAQGEEELRRRERAKIGQELFSVKSDVPLQFPAAFTFVFRAFTTLDGIGKTLDPGYDLTKIAQPYLKELVDLRDGNAYVSILNSFAKRVGWRREDIGALVTSPRRVKHIDDVARRLEEGDLKLQVRVMESEASFKRLEAQQGSLSAALLATLALNAGMALTGSGARGLVLLGRALFAVSAYCCAQVPIGYVRLWQLRQREADKGFR
ncbi:ABC1 family-domain-containing protein [Tribonema minus]|uniref:ABC1 family-domain-containing protein n=1 Tax=Tribonema minus TaxID=303371 RepID=A0A835YN99_9STRA|nr:ABC1 family-domain-containing protein [Tribonema minus]